VDEYNDQKLETPDMVVVNDTLVVFYSSTGFARLQRFAVGVATLALDGRSIRTAAMVDRPIRRRPPIIPTDLVNVASKTNNAQVRACVALDLTPSFSPSFQEPTAVLGADGQSYELFFTGLGVTQPNDALDDGTNNGNQIGPPLLCY
jgi:hypothetical protein